MQIVTKISEKISIKMHSVKNIHKSMQNMAAILNFKMAAQDAFEKNGSNSGLVV